jgi:nucleoside-diphosphate-sugar epimerase
MRGHRKRVLVTGGAGFLGSHLCDILVSKGYDVLCLDNFYTGVRDNISLRFCSSLSGYPRSRASAGSNAQSLQRFRVESISASFFIADEQSGQVFGLLWHGHPVRLLDGQ